MNKDIIFEKIKQMKDFLLSEHPKLKMKPIFLVGAGVALTGALYFFVLKDADFGKSEVANNENTTEQSANESSDSDKSIKEKFSEFFNPSEVVESDLSNFEVPSISSDILVVDESLIKSDEEEPKETEEPILAEEPVEEIVDFAVNEIDTSNSGRRDPMKSIVGNNTGTYDPSRASNLPADLKNESKNYFTGIAIEDIVLDYVSTDELGDNKKRADFIINGSYIPNLEVGDYLLEIYYVSKIDADKKTVTLQFGDKAYVLGAKNIYHTSNKTGGGNSTPSNSTQNKGTASQAADAK